MTHFRLCYRCEECGTLVPAAFTPRGKIQPPGRCRVCKPDDDPLVKRPGVGDIFRGLQLIEVSRPTKKWVCLCLWCKDLCTVHRTNIKKQHSCGCLTRTQLSCVNYSGLENGHYNCMVLCRVCGVTFEHDLLEPGPVNCPNLCRDNDDDYGL